MKWVLLVNCGLSLVDGVELDECEIDGLLLLKVDALDGSEFSEILLQIVLSYLKSQKSYRAAEVGDIDLITLSHLEISSFSVLVHSDYL